MSKENIKYTLDIQKDENKIHINKNKHNNTIIMHLFDEIFKEDYSEAYNKKKNYIKNLHSTLEVEITNEKLEKSKKVYLSKSEILHILASFN